MTLQGVMIHYKSSLFNDFQRELTSTFNLNIAERTIYSPDLLRKLFNCARLLCEVEKYWVVYQYRVSK